MSVALIIGHHIDPKTSNPEVGDSQVVSKKIRAFILLDRSFKGRNQFGEYHVEYLFNHFSFTLWVSFKSSVVQCFKSVFAIKINELVNKVGLLWVSWIIAV